jgi:hypothetical protein
MRRAHVTAMTCGVSWPAYSSARATAAHNESLLHGISTVRIGRQFDHPPADFSPLEIYDNSQGKVRSEVSSIQAV